MTVEQTGLNRNFATPDHLRIKVANSPAGVFIAFVTDEDAHSPVMLPVYDELVEYFENTIPLVVVDAKDERHSAPVKQCLVHAVPTLCWVTPSGISINVRSRHFGTTTLKKLVADIEPLYDDFLDE